VFSVQSQHDEGPSYYLIRVIGAIRGKTHFIALATLAPFVFFAVKIVSSG
jgi:hypothetical protein